VVRETQRETEYVFVHVSVRDKERESMCVVRMSFVLIHITFFITNFNIII